MCPLRFRHQETSRHRYLFGQYITNDDNQVFEPINRDPAGARAVQGVKRNLDLPCFARNSAHWQPPQAAEPCYLTASIGAAFLDCVLKDVGGEVPGCCGRQGIAKISCCFLGSDHLVGGGWCGIWLQNPYLVDKIAVAQLCINDRGGGSVGRKYARPALASSKIAPDLILEFLREIREVLKALHLGNRLWLREIQDYQRSYVRNAFRCSAFIRTYSCQDIEMKDVIALIRCLKTRRRARMCSWLEVHKITSSREVWYRDKGEQIHRWKGKRIYGSTSRPIHFRMWEDSMITARL